MSLSSIFLFPAPRQVIVFHRGRDFSFLSHHVKLFLDQILLFFSVLSGFLSFEQKLQRVCDRWQVTLSLIKPNTPFIVLSPTQRLHSLSCVRRVTRASEEAGRVIFFSKRRHDYLRIHIHKRVRERARSSVRQTETKYAL